MGNTLKENLDMIQDPLTYLKGHTRKVIYDAEHFFDGYKENRDYALSTLTAAVKAARTASFSATPTAEPCHMKSSHHCKGESDLQKKPIRQSPASESAFIPTMIPAWPWPTPSAAVRAGAVMVQGTINGYGERCGNADLTTIIPILCLKMNRTCVISGESSRLKKLSRFVSETANMIPQNTMPFVGKSAFAHKGGVHVSAIMKDPRAYEHIDPDLVGNKRKVLVSDISGKSNVEYKARELGMELNGSDRQKSFLKSSEWNRKDISLMLRTVLSRFCWKN